MLLELTSCIKIEEALSPLWASFLFYVRFYLKLFVMNHILYLK